MTNFAASGKMDVELLTLRLLCAIRSKRRQRRGQRDVGSMRNIRCEVKGNCFGQQGRLWDGWMIKSMLKKVRN